MDLVSPKTGEVCEREGYPNKDKFSDEEPTVLHCPATIT